VGVECKGVKVQHGTWHGAYLVPMWHLHCRGYDMAFMMRWLCGRRDDVEFMTWCPLGRGVDMEL